MISGWAIAISSTLVNNLASKRPEALVIFAYYAVILHWHRNMWVIGNGGKVLIGSISNYLGPDWEALLRWPLTEVQK